MPGKAVVAIATLAILFLGVGAVATQYQDTVEETQPLQTVENETFAPAEGESVALNESFREAIYNESVTVRQSGTIFDPAGNYTWNGGTGPGTLDVVNGTGLNTSADANVTYAYRVPSSSQEITKDVGEIPITLGKELAVIMGALVLMGGCAVLLLGGGY